MPLEPEMHPLVQNKHDLVSVGDAIGGVVLSGKHPRGWWVGFLAGFAMLQILMIAVLWLFYIGVGIWGINVPVAWGFAIVNFVWWIGIGHAGTLISAILLLMHQKWRTSINRFSEAMTIFAVMCAGMFPLLHMGRPWFFYWLYPFPNVAGVWPQFRSPLAWDVFAVTTYFTVSLVFWYLGLVPDLAALRDSARTRTQRIVYGILALGWRGSAIHWRRYEKVYLLLAGISTPLVLSVHTVVSFDFAVSIVPLWHATIFPPFFVAGAIYSGFAMVVALAIPIRKWYKLEDFFTDHHLDICGKVMLATGFLVTYGYFSEAWMAWYGHSLYEWVRLVVLDPDLHQLRFPAHVPLVEAHPPERLLARTDLRLGADRDVVRAVRDRDHAEPRVHPGRLGSVRPDDLGLRDDDWVSGVVPHPVLPVHPVPADDLDNRDA
jgi:molybdopterin-containing oxidoreductase family membrane subunit